MYGTEEDSEFHCDIRTICMSADNILREIRDDKGKKYPNGDVDLFVFVLPDEYECVLEYLNNYQWNRAAQHFLNTILTSPFPAVYLCVWDFVKQTYEINNPLLLKFSKTKGGGLQWTLLSGNLDGLM